MCVTPDDRGGGPSGGPRQTCDQLCPGTTTTGVQDREGTSDFVCGGTESTGGSVYRGTEPGARSRPLRWTPDQDSGATPTRDSPRRRGPLSPSSVGRGVTSPTVYPKGPCGLPSRPRVTLEGCFPDNTCTVKRVFTKVCFSAHLLLVPDSAGTSPSSGRFETRRSLRRSVTPVRDPKAPTQKCHSVAALPFSGRFRPSSRRLCLSPVSLAVVGRSDVGPPWTNEVASLRRRRRPPVWGETEG